MKGGLGTSSLNLVPIRIRPNPPGGRPVNTKTLKTMICALSMALVAATAMAGEAPAPTADEQLAALETMCAESGDARAARHAETSLYERLGGEESIHELTREIVRLHSINPQIQRTVEGVSHKRLAHRVAQFVISGTGGPKVYDGPTLNDSHEHLKLSNADFLAAGSDVILAMKNLEYGQNEIDEMVCILVSLRHHVVIEEDKELASSR